MANDKTIFDATNATLGVDSQANPSYLPPPILSLAINRQLRGGVNKTRDAFVEIELQAAGNQDESIVKDFMEGNFQGAWPYESLTPNSADGIVVASAGKIYFIAIANGIGYLYRIAEGNDPTMMHTWFCQAENWMYIQNGRQNPIAWDGTLDGTPSNLQALGIGSPQTTPSPTATRARSSNTVTITTSNPILLTVGQWVEVTNLADATFNGIFQVTGVPSTTSFTYTAIGPNVGSTADTGGTARPYLGQIRLTWEDMAVNEDHYEIEVYQGGNYQTIQTNGTEYIYEIADPDVDYTFKVRAVYPDGTKSQWSNTATTSSNNTVITTEYPPSIGRLNPAKGEMPIGTIMCYAYGRVLVSDAQNNIRASDIIYGNGFTDTSNTRNFTEDTYWNEGGSFTPPANLGEIRGMTVSPSININDRGQGEVVVACENGFFTLNVSIDRTMWLDNNIQKTSLIGRGCTSPWSMVLANNEIIFRSNDGWSLYNNSQVDFTNSFSFKNISKEMNPWVNSDTPWMRQFASGMFFDNRFLGTVSPFALANEYGQGMHRPHRAIVVLDLDKSTSVEPDANVGFRWNGLWEGPQPTQLLTANIEGVERGFVFSFDPDGVNRLYEIQKGMPSDVVSNQTKPIKSSIIFRKMDFAINKFLYKKLTGGEFHISDIVQPTVLRASYRPDNYPCFEDWSHFNLYCNDCDKESECEFVNSEPRSYRRKLPTPNQKVRQLGSGAPMSMASEFQLKLDIEGRATIDRMRLSAMLNPVDDHTRDCPDAPIDCTPIDCCQFNALDYYRII